MENTLIVFISDQEASFPVSNRNEKQYVVDWSRPTSDVDAGRENSSNVKV